MMSEKFDNMQKRCPMLGHPLTFNYCRNVNTGAPCRKIMDCWFEQIPIQQYIEENYTPETIKNLLQPPKPKITSLLELIEQARATMPDSQS